MERVGGARARSSANQSTMSIPLKGERAHGEECTRQMKPKCTCTTPECLANTYTKQASLARQSEFVPGHKASDD